MILIITYDLKTPKDYHDFYEAIKAQATEGKWWHYMASTWILSTTRTPQQVADNIRPLLEAQDFLFVCELTSNYQGWLPKPAWDWLRAEFPQTNYWQIIGEALEKASPPSPSYNALAGGLLGGPPKNPLAGTGALGEPPKNALVGLLGEPPKQKP